MSSDLTQLLIFCTSETVTDVVSEEVTEIILCQGVLLSYAEATNIHKILKPSN